MHCRAPPAWEEELIGRPWKGDGTCAYYISVSMQEAEGPKRVAQRRFSKAEVWFGLAQPSGEAEGSPKTEPICDSRLGNGGVSQDHSWREQASSQFSAHRQGGSSRFWILKRVPDWRRAGCRQWVASTGPLPSKAVGPFLSIANATNSFCLWAGTERPHLCGRMWQWMAPVFAWRGYGFQASIPCPPETHDLPLRLHQMEKQHLQDPHPCDFFPHQTWNIKIFPLTGILRSGVHSCLGSKAFDLVCRGGKKIYFFATHFINVHNLWRCLSKPDTGKSGNKLIWVLGNSPPSCGPLPGILRMLWASVTASSGRSASPGYLCVGEEVKGFLCQTGYHLGDIREPVRQDWKHRQGATWWNLQLRSWRNYSGSY